MWRDDTPLSIFKFQDILADKGHIFAGLWWIFMLVRTEKQLRVLKLCEWDVLLIVNMWISNDFYVIS